MTLRKFENSYRINSNVYFYFSNLLINCTQFQKVNDIAAKVILAKMKDDPLKLELALEKTLVDFLKRIVPMGLHSVWHSQHDLKIENILSIVGISDSEKEH